MTFFAQGGRALLLLLPLLLLSPAPSRGAGAAGAGAKKVLAVMSYHDGVEIEQEIKAALDEKLAGVEVTYVWLDTKRRLGGGAERAREAYALYRELAPDVVVAADDSAQELFVVPFLREKVPTPVVFCGVNNDAGKYGYPAANVTGVLEKKHYRESIAFAQIVDPRIRTVGVIYSENPSNSSNLDQIRRERESYTAEVTDLVRVATLEELRRAVSDLGARTDALLALDLSGLVDERGRLVEERRCHELVAGLSAKPTIGTSAWEIGAGTLCGVVKRDREQGTLAAELVRAILEGSTPPELPVTENRNGRRYLNLETAQRLGLRVRPEAIAGTEVLPTRHE